MASFLLRTYEMLKPRTSQASTKSTCSPAAAAGVTPSTSRASQESPACGPPHAHVSRSRTPGSDAVRPTHATSGLKPCASLRSAALQLSLESRLHQRLVLLGSDQYELIWKHWAMQSGPPICRLAARALRILGKEFTGLPTPRAQDGRARKTRDHAQIRIGMVSQGRNYPCYLEDELSLRHGSGKYLNPHFLYWMMGFPKSWVRYSA